jgi:hypothetical protein
MRDRHPSRWPSRLLVDVLETRYREDRPEHFFAHDLVGPPCAGNDRGREEIAATLAGLTARRDLDVLQCGGSLDVSGHP